MSEGVSVKRRDEQVVKRTRKTSVLCVPDDDSGEGVAVTGQGCKKMWPALTAERPSPSEHSPRKPVAVLLDSLADAVLREAPVSGSTPHTRSNVAFRV